EPTRKQGERQEVQPADDVLARCRTGGAVRLGRGWRAVADAEGEDPGDDVAVRRDGAPANRVRTLDQPLHRRLDDAVAVRGPRGPRDDLPLRGEDPDRVRQDLDALVELEPHAARSARQA